jgi:RNA polymerase sigma-70 factor (ECF subfamily)
MSTNTADFAPEQYRGFLLLMARMQWNDMLRNWGDPSDLVHQTLLEAHQKLGTFEGRTPAAFVAWLKKILKNNLYDVSRALHSQKHNYVLKQSLDVALEESSSRLGLSLALDDPSPSSLVAATEKLNLLADALTLLPADQMDAVTLHHLQGLSLEATAAKMNRTQASVAGLLRRGLKQLGSLLIERGVQ